MGLRPISETAFLKLLGPPILELGGRPVMLARRKTTALLAYLALEGGTHARDRLAAFFWPESTQGKARANLRSSIFEINHALGRSVLVTEQDRIRLAPGGIRVDIDEFRALAAECGRHRSGVNCTRCVERLEAVPRAWRNGFMPGFALPDSADFDDWQIDWSGRLRGEYRSVLRRLAAALLELGRLAEAADYARRWIEAEPFEEEARALRLRILVMSGRRTEALEGWREWERTAEAELGRQPARATADIVAGLLSRPGAAPVDDRAVVGFRTRLVGRDAELAYLGTLLSSALARIVTIVGPGGIGKTALARALLVEHGGEFEGGAYLVDLADLRDPELVPNAAAEAMGLHETHGYGDRPRNNDPAARIIGRLGGARTLLVFDNFERVLAARAFVVRLIEQCPALLVMATSREALGAESECVLELQPLGLPGDAAAVSAANAASWPALELLLARAAEANPAFELTDANAPRLAALAIGLGGLPLALELAAPRLATLEPGEPAAPAARLGGSLDPADDDGKGKPSLHRTLRAALDWSHDLLTPAERTLFARLAVFHGGFDLDAAEAIQASAGSKGAGSVTDGLASLAAKSLLLRVVEEGQIRFSFLEPVRNYAAGLLAAMPDGDSTADLHARHFLRLAESLGPAMRGERQLEAFRRLKLERANLGAALDHFLKKRLVEESLRLCAALEWYWRRAGSFELGRRSLQSALALAASSAGGGAAASPMLGALRGRCLNAFGWFRFTQGAWPEAHALYLVAAEILEAAADRIGLVRCLSDLGVVERRMGNAAAGDARCRDAIEMARTCGDPSSIAYALIWGYGTTGGQCVDEGQRKGLEEAVRLARRTGDVWAEAHALDSLGDWLRERGRADEATPCFEESLRGFDALGDEGMKAWTLEGLGLNLCLDGVPRRGRARLRDALGIFVRLGDRGNAARIIGELGCPALGCDDRQTADLLLGAYSSLAADLGLGYGQSPVRSSIKPKPDGVPKAGTVPDSALEASLREASTRASREWRRGRRLAWNEAVAAALNPLHASHNESGTQDGEG